MKLGDDNTQNKEDLPLFMNYTKAIDATKNGNELPYDVVKTNRDKLKKRINYRLNCPMNHLQACLDKIQGATRKNSIPTKEFFIKMNGKATAKHVSKIRKLVEEYDIFVKKHYNDFDDEAFIIKFNEVTESFYQSIGGVKINNIITINRLIETALSIDSPNNASSSKLHEGSKYCRRMLNTLYKTNKDKFLMNFC